MIGSIPVAADCAPGGLNVGPAEVEAALTERTRAIVVAHIAGIAVDLDPILRMARDRGIPLVEDCAQAHGAKYKGRMCGTFGDIATFSTMFGKQHATGGQGGIVYTRREDLHWKARRYADRGKPFGLEGQAQNVVRSLNFNMDELHAAIGRANLAKLPGFVAQRRKVVARLIERCSGLKTVSVWSERDGDEASYWFIVLRLDLQKLRVGRDAFARALTAEGLPAAPGYPFFITEMPWASERCAACGRTETCELEHCCRRHWRRPELPRAHAFEAAAVRVMIHEGWTEREADDLAAALVKIEASYIR